MLYQKYIFFSFFLLITVISGCDRKRGQLINDNLKIYKVQQLPGKDSFFQWDELVEKIELIPLETSGQSVIGKFTKGIVKDNSVFIFDSHFQSLLHFDISGTYQKRIGYRGKGPGEVLEIRDFCITDSILYTLDYKKVHAYGIFSGNYVESWSFGTDNGFNPTSFLVYDKDNYYLWASNPDIWEPDKGTYYKMRKMRQGKVGGEYFEYEYKANADPRFFCNNLSCYFNNGRDTIYTVTKDSVAGSFFLDFGDMSLSSSHLDELKITKNLNDFYRSNAFKEIDCIFKVNDFLYFMCTGPDAYVYEGVVNEKKGIVSLGRKDFRRSPFFFFADKNILYGYYEPYSLIENKNNGTDVNLCFANLLDMVPNIDLEDNPVLVKVYLK